MPSGEAVEIEMCKTKQPELIGWVERRVLGSWQTHKIGQQLPPTLEAAQLQLVGGSSRLSDSVREGVRDGWLSTEYLQLIGNWNTKILLSEIWDIYLEEHEKTLLPPTVGCHQQRPGTLRWRYVTDTMQWESKWWCPMSTLSREVKSVHGPTLSAEHLQVTNDWNTETLTREIFKIEAITQQVLCSILAFVWKEKFFSISDCVPTYLTYLNLWWSWNIISNKYEGSITERLKTWSLEGGGGGCWDLF